MPSLSPILIKNTQDAGGEHWSPKPKMWVQFLPFVQDKQKKLLMNKTIEELLEEFAERFDMKYDYGMSFENNEKILRNRNIKDFICNIIEERDKMWQGRIEAIEMLNKLSKKIDQQ